MVCTSEQWGLLDEGIPWVWGGKAIASQPPPLKKSPTKSLLFIEVQAVAEPEGLHLKLSSSVNSAYRCSVKDELTL